MRADEKTHRRHLPPPPPPSLPQARQKMASLVEVATRVLLAPLLALLSLLAAHERVVWDEPAGYRAPGWRRWMAQRRKECEYGRGGGGHSKYTLIHINIRMHT